MHFVKSASYVSEYKLLLTFEDGSKRIADLAPYLEGEIFEPLKNIEYFKKVYVNHDIETIMWENGADMSPDFLYKISTPIDQSASAR